MGKAEELEKLRQASPLIHDMNYDQMRQLCEVLDVGDMWIDVAHAMPDIGQQDVDACKKVRDYDRNSPTLFLFRIWASKGYTIVDLYNLFAITRLVRCMRLIRNQVDPAFHYLEEYCAPAKGEAKGGTVARAPSSLSARSHGFHAGTSNMATGGPSSVRTPTTAAVGTAVPSSSKAGTTSATGASGRSDDANMFSGMKNTPALGYSEILTATNNFDASNIIGKGGYGVVYRGIWKHNQVAVKRLASKNENDRRHQQERLHQSLQELKTLAHYRHDNILPIYGYSLDGPEPCLKGTIPLTWEQKATIALGSAMALHFLHTIDRMPLIHGDVKTANILLDKHLEPKLGDFGLSREGLVEIGVEDKSVLIASHIKGTLAYLPPEFINNKMVTTKLDVYSFGVVLLEIATGLRAYVDMRAQASIVDYCSNIDAKEKASRKEAGETVAIALPTQKIYHTYSDKRTPEGANPG